MPFAGTGWLLLWNDFVREREGDYDDWHTREHVPERVAVEGFRAGRRYADRERDTHRHFTLYELDDLSALDRPEYRALVDTPTPSSASMRPDFRNVLRAPCRVVSSAGLGIGGAVACVRMRGAPRDADRLASLADRPGIVGCHVAAVVGTAAPPAWTPSRPAGDPPQAFDHVVLIEALDRAAAQRALDEARPSLGDRAIDAAIYTLAFVFPGSDPGERERRRRPGVPSTAPQDPAG